MQERATKGGTFPSHAIGPPDPGRGSAAPDGPRSGANGEAGEHHRSGTYSTTSPASSRLDDNVIDAARAVPVLEVARQFGAELRREGAEWIGPCPVCGGRDRFAVNPAKAVWSCRTCEKRGGGVIDLYMHVTGVPFRDAVRELVGEGRGGIDHPARPIGDLAVATIRNADDKRARVRVARLLWSKSVPIAGTIAETYLRDVRGIRSPLPPTLRFLPGRGDYPDAMVAALGTCCEPEPSVIGALEHEVGAVHLTSLLPDGSGKAYRTIGGEPTAKTFIASPDGRPIVLAGWSDANALFVTGGIEDGLTAADAGAGAVWAAGSGPHMRALTDTVPSWCEGVTILADDNDTDRRGAFDLAAGLHQRGIDASVRLTATRRAAT